MNTIPDLIPLHDSRPGLRSLVQVEVRDAVTTEPAALDFIASTATLDRYREVIEPTGWRLDSYRRNPVFQNAHNYGDILFTLGKALVTEVRAVNGGQALCQRIQFAVDVNPVARIAYGLYKGGFLNAVSVGFIPLRWEDGGTERGASERGASERGASERGASEREASEREASEREASERGAAPRRRYVEQELLEVSAVAIPANPDALALGLKSGAIGKSDVEDTVELLRALVGARGRAEEQPNELLDLARELRRVMQKA